MNVPGFYWKEVDVVLWPGGMLVVGRAKRLGFPGHGWNFKEMTEIEIEEVDFFTNSL